MNTSILQLFCMCIVFAVISFWVNNQTGAKFDRWLTFVLGVTSLLGAFSLIVYLFYLLITGK